VSDSEDRLAPAERLVYAHSLINESRPGEGAIVVLRDGSFRMLIRSSAINFSMRSPAEKGVLTRGFGALCDSLEVGFPIQICSHSKLVDPNRYTDQFRSPLKNANTPEPLRQLIRSHIQQYSSQVEHSQIMSRETFIVIPWRGVDKPENESALKDIPLMGFFRNMKNAADEDKLDLNQKPSDIELGLARQQLQTRSNQIIGRLGAIGLDARRLSAEEIRILIYGYFHPSLSTRQRDPGFQSGDQLMSGFSSRGLTDEEQRQLGAADMIGYSEDEYGNF